MTVLEATALIVWGLLVREGSTYFISLVQFPNGTGHCTGVDS